MDRNQQSSFLELRRRLAELNYTETFGVEYVELWADLLNYSSSSLYCFSCCVQFFPAHSALELVSRLLEDLVSTTHSYKRLQETETRLGADLALAQAQLFPLRKENARLARENHELHVESIRLNDELRSSLEDYGKSTRHLHNELNELHYLADSQKQQLKAKDELIDRLRDVSRSNSTGAIISLNQLIDSFPLHCVLFHAERPTSQRQIRLCRDQRHPLRRTAAPSKYHRN